MRGLHFYVVNSTVNLIKKKELVKPLLTGADARAELATGLNRLDGDTATNISTALIPNSIIESFFNGSKADF